MTTRIERFTGLNAQQQPPAFIIALGHGAIHWILATLYLLLPYITESLQISYVEAGFLITLVHASAFAANFVSGLMVDMIGRRVVLQFLSLILGALSIASLLLVSSYWMLIVPVIIIGMTNNLWHPAAISFLSGYYPNNRGYALSIHTLGASLGDAVAPVAIGALLISLSWNQTALVGAFPVVVIALVVLVSLTRLEKTSPQPHTQGVTAATYFQGLKSIFSNRSAMGLCLMAGFRSMAQNGLLMFIPIYLANDLKAGPFLTGLGMLALQIGGFIAGPVAGTWSDKIGRRPVVLAGITATTLVVIFLTFAGNETLFIVGVSILGFALFAIRPVIHSWMMDITPPHMAGSATSALFGTQSALSMLIPITGGFVADQFGVGAVFYLIAACMIIANALVVLLPADTNVADGSRE